MKTLLLLGATLVALVAAIVPMSAQTASASPCGNGFASPRAGRSWWRCPAGRRIAPHTAVASTSSNSRLKGPRRHLGGLIGSRKGVKVAHLRRAPGNRNKGIQSSARFAEITQLVPAVSTAAVSAGRYFAPMSHANPEAKMITDTKRNATCIFA